MSPRYVVRLAAVACLALSLLVFSPAAADPAGVRPAADPAAPGAAGEITTIPDWRMRTSAGLTAGGEAISSPGFDASGWLVVPRRSTVMAGLIANNRYPDVTYSTNMRDNVRREDFAVPWWYRRSFTAKVKPGRQTFLRLNGGVIARGEVWVNGTRVAGTDRVVGAYPTHEFDVTALLRTGANAVAIKAMPSDPQRDLVIHFIDWAQLPPDRSQGLYRDVQLAQSGPVSLRDVRVQTALALPGLERADLTVKAEARNNTVEPVTTEVCGAIGAVTFRQKVSLAPGESKTVTFAPPAFPQLSFERPQVWWPYQMGGQPLYELAMTATAAGAISDTARLGFGVRDVRSRLTSQGYRQFEVNGHPLLVRGGGWASDLFLRTDERKIADQLRYVRDLGLNTIRLEGKPENEELYDLADRLGILIMPGWECCSKWEEYDSWSEWDYATATASAAAEARRIRNHPSILGFLIGSDLAPPSRVEKAYLDGLRAAEWNLPIVSAATDDSSPRLGRSGMKMAGPYWWVPPVYWYNEQLGGAFGFASEIGSGPTIPELDSMRKFLSTGEIDNLWRNYNTTQYHLAPTSMFAKLAFWGTALDRRYGKPTSLPDFVRKAQVTNYEVNRAQFEAFRREQSDPAKPTTGVIYWMLNDAWPTLYWNLYDYNLAPAGSYFGAKAGLRPLHVQYSYDNRSVVLVNGGLDDAPGLWVQTTVFNLDGGVKADDRVIGRTAKGNASTRVAAVPTPGGLSKTYFVRLLVGDGAGRVLDRNVYWLSTQADTLNYGGSTWYHTPQSGYADLTGLNGLSAATVSARATSSAIGERVATTATLTNTTAGSKVAFFVRTSVRKGPGGAEVLPVTWTDNYVTLWPGESVTLRSEYRRADLGGVTPAVQVSGWNIPTTEIPAAF